MIIADPWHGLKAFTAARIALGRTGTAIPMQEVLRFKLAHAHARDAVHSSLDITAFPWEINLLHSNAADRAEYLQRPDKGRQLQESSRLSLTPGHADIGIILVDGLSATAVNHHAVPVLAYLFPMLQAKKISCARIQLVQQGRVAIGDEIGELLGVKLVLVLIGERPGLTSPDSLGAYLTWQPRPGLTDEARNCISNIRPEGLPYQLAAEKMFYLINEALRLHLTGVMLKDNYSLRIS
ncbi:ethanolamine ammonia-lyase subunit EutC [Chitinophaga niabensis]|uniref:Ethanolamine ammonia-lyase small subunit n=1 Tax=Chitinophaga niabensis TaxID=536979 RepID=A0A1N6KDP6_9BACT|nr:ethanolamine ammonia-lyase subunit EutC [Chitinophaga niabensis]SIO54719.1 Ethanolamine ammonia-lyase light chain [Chitinophaga niabensis]